MSTLVTALIPASFHPTEAAVIARAASLGASLYFPEGFHVDQDYGLVPCLLNQQAAAFELTHEETSSTADHRGLHFEARASYASFAACAVVAATIALLADGQVRDDDGEEIAGAQIEEWLQSIELPGSESDSDTLRIPVTVVGPRSNAFLQLRLEKVPAGAHLARRLVESIDVSLVPPHLRKPNSQFIIVVRDASEIVAVESLPR